jgi:hypothetical protein
MNQLPLLTFNYDRDTFRPSYQFHFKDLTIRPVSADEPKLPHFSAKLALDYVEQGVMAWTRERQGVSSHTNGSYVVVPPLRTSQRGQPQEEI